MLKETGRVVAIDQDGLWVETLKQSACASCAAKSGCGQKLLAGTEAAASMTFIKAFFTDNSKSYVWHEGDQAILGVKENALIFAGLIAYGIPILCMIFGMMLGVKWNFSLSMDASAALGALIGLFVGGGLVKIHERLSYGKQYYRAFVVGKGLDVEIHQ